jgi:hypothetical protein
MAGSIRTHDIAAVRHGGRRYPRPGGGAASQVVRYPGTGSLALWGTATTSNGS